MSSVFGYSQQEKENTAPAPLAFSLNEDGSQFVRLLTWHQFWVTTQNLKNSDNVHLTPSIRRMRFLLIGQLSPSIITGIHFGLNGLNSKTLNTTGNSGLGPQFFLHEAWMEFKIIDEIQIGGGLHYWQGLNRLANSSTITFMTMDHTHPCLGWGQIGYTNQYGRNLGIYLKGQINNFDYRVILSDPIENGFEANLGTEGLTSNKAQYNVINLFDGKEGSLTLEGYFRYQFLERESTTLPYTTGTYLGEKRIFNIGTGFFYQPNGSLTLLNDDIPVDGNLKSEELIADLYAKTQLHKIAHYSVDVFFEMPLTHGAITAYSTWIRFDYGPNWIGKNSGTGDAWYAHCGYLMPDKKFQPYLAFQLRKFQAHYNSDKELGKTLHAGLNYYITGHHAKLTLEYMQINQAGFSDSRDPDSGSLRFQAQVYF